jgi:hypothetical protein
MLDIFTQTKSLSTYYQNNRMLISEVGNSAQALAATLRESKEHMHVNLAEVQNNNISSEHSSDGLVVIDKCGWTLIDETGTGDAKKELDTYTRTLADTIEEALPQPKAGSVEANLVTALEIR